MIGGILNRLLGRGLGDNGVYVPAMDGPFHPNTFLDDATALVRKDGATDMTAIGETVYLAVGQHVLGLHDGDVSAFRAFEGTVTAITAVGDTLVAAESGKGLHWCSETEDVFVALPASDADCVTALGPLADGRVACCVGSQTSSAAHWRRDLLQRNRSGKVALVGRDGAVEVVSHGLAWCGGVLELAPGRLVVSESWAHRLVEIGVHGHEALPVVEDLAGYPGRLCMSATGEIALAVFAPRRTQFEFVLSERRFCADMIAQLPEADWIAPALSRDATRPDLPIVQGEIRQMGVMKPWAATASYGLVVALNSALKPMTSWHSRADGNRHGITATVWQANRLLALSAATGEVLDLGAGGHQ